jgi:hypothetical protein
MIYKNRNGFADLVFGTPKFVEAQKLTDLKKALEEALARGK